MNATSIGTANATARGAGGGLAAIDLLYPTADANGMTRTYIGADTDLTATSVTGTATSTTNTNAQDERDRDRRHRRHRRARPSRTCNEHVRVHRHQRRRHRDRRRVAHRDLDDNTSTAHTDAVSASLIGISLYDLDASTTSYTGAFVGDKAHVTVGSLALSATATDTPVISVRLHGHRRHQRRIRPRSTRSTRAPSRRTSARTRCRPARAATRRRSRPPAPAASAMSATSHAVVDVSDGAVHARAARRRRVLEGDRAVQRDRALVHRRLRAGQLGPRRAASSSALSNPNVRSIGKGFSGALRLLRLELDGRRRGERHGQGLHEGPRHAVRQLGDVPGQLHAERPQGQGAHRARRHRAPGLGRRRHRDRDVEPDGRDLRRRQHDGRLHEHASP